MSTTTGRRALVGQLVHAGKSSQPWGTVAISAPVRYGWRGYRLTVYSPGTSDVERQLMWVGRNMPFLAAAVILPLMMALQPIAPPMSTLLLVPVGVGIVAMVRNRTRSLRRSVRALDIAYVTVDGSTRVLGNGTLMNDSVKRLRDADRALAAGDITTTEYERRWGLVYDRLDDASRE